VANLIGGLIFFWIDRCIFTAKDMRIPVWSIMTSVRCADCGREGRGYRLVKSATYDRAGEAQPEYRCEACSVCKALALQERGVTVE
jgi:DNA-directed RNA polymerase subunit RPC12/RpoP